MNGSEAHVTRALQTSTKILILAQFCSRFTHVHILKMGLRAGDDSSTNPEV